KIGVMVESAPHDRKRLAPNMAKPIEPAMKAKKPICGAKPPSRAVAICSGIAIAANVRPAIRSPGRFAARNARSERKIGHWPAESSGPVRAIDHLLPASPMQEYSPIIRQKASGGRRERYFARAAVIALRISA